MFNNLGYDKILLVSSSIGFRAPSPVGTRFLPFRLKIFPYKKTPWILDYYSNNCIRFYKTGFTLVDFLVYIDKYDIELAEFKYAVFNFGIVEGWLRDSFDNSDDGEASWHMIMDRLLVDTKGTKYYNIMNVHKQNVINDKLPKTILSEEVLKDSIRELCNKIENINNVVFVTYGHSLYKKYTQESIFLFNKVIKNLSIENNYNVLNFDVLELYDGVHLNYNSHFKVSNKIQQYFAFHQAELGNFRKILFSFIEYFKFRKYNIDNFFNCSVKKDILSKITKGLK